MKKMMMALAALCVAGAAGAVSLDWTTSDWTPMGEKGREDGHGITADSAFGLNGNNYGTFVLVGSLKKTEQYKWVTEVCGQNARGGMQNYVAVGINNSGNWAILNNQGWGNATVTTKNVKAEAGAYVIGFSMVNEEGTATVTVSVNGTVIAKIAGGLTGTTGIVQSDAREGWGRGGGFARLRAFRRGHRGASRADGAGAAGARRGRVGAPPPRVRGVARKTRPRPAGRGFVFCYVAGL